MAPLRLPKYAAHFGLLFVVAPIATYVAFKPASDVESTAWARRYQPNPEVMKKREAIVALVKSKDQDKEKTLEELMKKGTSSSSSSSSSSL